MSMQRLIFVLEIRFEKEEKSKLKKTSCHSQCTAAGKLPEFLQRAFYIPKAVENRNCQ